MEIDKRLNLVLALERGEGQVNYVHSTPVARAVFQANVRLISRTMTMMVNDDLGVGGQVRVAAEYLKEAARELDGPEGDRYQKAADAFVQEIYRLSNVWLPGERGWETMMLPDAIARKMISEDQVSEVTNILVYFTAASWFNNPKERKNIYTMLETYGAQTGSWDSTAYGRSLPISTPAASSGETATASSIAH